MSKNADGDLTESELERLTLLLASLPVEIQFLREPILAIAAQDQDLLGSGDADTSKLDDALAAQLREDFDLSLTTILKQFRKWAKKVAATENDTWIGPVHFVTGYLKGAEWLTVEELTEPRPVPKRGLFKIAMDIPADAKTTFLVGGAQIKIRGVEIIVAEEVNPNHWAGSDVQLTDNWSGIPHRKSLVENDLKIGEATAKRLSLTDANTGRCSYAQYLLAFPTLQIQAVISTRRATGFDLTMYEPILASIRPK